jgi:hypothetical protein
VIRPSVPSAEPFRHARDIRATTRMPTLVMSDPTTTDDRTTEPVSNRRKGMAIKRGNSRPHPIVRFGSSAGNRYRLLGVLDPKMKLWCILGYAPAGPLWSNSASQQCNRIVSTHLVRSACTRSPFFRHDRPVKRRRSAAIPPQMAARGALRHASQSRYEGRRPRLNRHARVTCAASELCAPSRDENCSTRRRAVRVPAGGPSAYVRSLSFTGNCACSRARHGVVHDALRAGRDGRAVHDIDRAGLRRRDDREPP